jgi:hypothetical protein
MKVFLGGTCAESKWREKLIPLLKCDYFNPVVEDWTPECQENEEREKKICDYHLYVITPKMKGVFSIAEAVNDSKDHAHCKCIFCMIREEDDREWEKSEYKSLCAVSNMVANNGGIIFGSLNDVADYLNNEYEKIEKRQKEIDGERMYGYYKKRTEHLLRLFNKLIKEILPEGWYCMAMDTWQCEEEEVEECIRRLNRPFVQKLIKRGKF